MSQTDAATKFRPGVSRPKFTEAVYRYAALAAALMLLSLGLSPDARAGGGHYTAGYHMHVGGAVLTCNTVAECHDEQEQRLLSVPPGSGGCAEGVQKNGTTGPFKYFSSHWYLTTSAQCIYDGVASGINYGYVFTWYIPDIPAECNQGDNPPECPYEGPEYTLEAPGQCTAGNNDETNPCNPANGNKSQVELDYASSAAGGLRFARFYNSKGAYKTAANLAPGWRHSYSRAIDEEPDRKPQVLFSAPANQSGFYAAAADACTNGWNDLKNSVWAGSLSTATAGFAGGNVCKISSGGSTVAHFPVRSAVGWTGFSGPANFKTVTRPNGTSLKFELISSNWVNELNPSLKLEQSGGNWIFTDTNDTRETFDSSGRLISITYRNGQTETLAYNLTVPQGGDGDSSTLDKVTGPFGHTLTLTYDTNGRLGSVTTPDGDIQYAYGTRDNLISVTFPDATTRQYLYEDAIYSGLGNHLNGLIDENSDQYATWEYDSAGRAISSEHAGGKERVQLAYNGDGTTTLTMANGAVRTYTFTTEQGQRRLSSLTGDVCSTCPGGNVKSRSYDANGFVAELTDWNNNVTKTARNARGLVETLTEGFGSLDERVTTAVWHANYRLPAQVTSPRNVTDYTHDANGNVLTLTLSGGGKTRTWTFTYNASGQPLTIDGPRTDVTDLTTLEYYTCTTGNECGQLKKVTNALGHVTNYDTYDNAGRLTQMTGPNGLQVSFTYDNRGRLLTTTETPPVGTARVTTMTYDNAGQLATYTLPNGTVLTYAYSAAHYLTSVTDNLGNAITYDYDAMGNLTDEDTYDPLSALKRTMDYAHDKNYRLDTITDGGFTTDLSFDLLGNLTDTTNPNSALTQHSYDALNRLDTTTDALLGVTDYSYDDHDNVTQVAAPNGATTIFAYDQLDNLLSETSPDRGLITYTYDDAGNRLTETDARSVTGTYAYEALNRPVSITYPNMAENVTFTYDDVASNGIGRLRSVSDQSGSITYDYNAFGDIVTDQRQISSFTYTTSYQYDAAGNVSSISYPSGRTIDYVRDAVGQVTSVASTKSGIVESIVSSASYEPFGPLSGLTYGNGVSFDYEHRVDYRLSRYSSPNVADKAYTRDPAGNIAAIGDDIDGNRSTAYGFDALNHLTSEIVQSPYSDKVLAKSPLVYWPLGETSGTVAVDKTGNGFNASYDGTIALGEPGLAPGTDSAIRVNSVGDGHVAGPTLLGVTATGFEAWFRTESLSDHRYIFGLYHSQSDRFTVFHRIGGLIAVISDAVGIAFLSDSAVSVGEPHHIAVWYESGTNTTYTMIDGVTQSNTYTGNLLGVTDPQVKLGGYQYYVTFYRQYLGELDEVAIYNTPVDAATFSDRTLPLSFSASYDYTYDPNGNRATFDDGTTVTTLGYQTQTNKLTSIDAAPLQRDLSGNRIADVGGTRTYTYNNANRLSAVLDGGLTTATYVHNALGQRTRKTVVGTDVIYLYDLAGNLLAEHDATGAMIRDYVWMNGAPVAQIDSGEVFSYLHVDHLNTPRLATDDSQTVVWRWDSDAFGTTLADEDPDGDLSATTVNLRFPGQYFDAETGFHYNYFRTYDPGTGRYLESDPIGLSGDPNSYVYAVSAPLSHIDPLGLDSLIFNGKELSRIDDDGKTVQSWPAVSGRIGTGRSNMYRRNIGPVPEGSYSIDPSKTNRDRLWKIGWGSRTAWGKVRTPIDPKDGTFTNGRSGFYVHGGAFPGSAGCIDLTNSNEDFHNWLEKLKDPIDLVVDYPGPVLESLEDGSEDQ